VILFQLFFLYGNSAFLKHVSQQKPTLNVMNLIKIPLGGGGYTVLNSTGSILIDQSNEVFFFFWTPLNNVLVIFSV